VLAFLATTSARIIPAAGLLVTRGFRDGIANPSGASHRTQSRREAGDSRGYLKLCVRNRRLLGRSDTRDQKQSCVSHSSD
jgi:hypothetical protein